MLDWVIWHYDKNTVLNESENKMLLEDFEYAVHNNQYETAAKMLIEILQGFDSGYGAFPNTLQLKSISALNADELQENVVNRLAAAMGTLFAKKEFTINKEAGWQEKILSWHRWISAIYAASAYRNGDAYLRSLFNHSLTEAEELKTTPFQLDNSKIYKLALLFTQESEIPIDMESIWNTDRVTALNLAIALLSARFSGSEAAHTKREILLGWLPAKLREYGTLDGLAGGVLHDVFMHCSYADRADKHEIKYVINELIRKNLLANGFSDLSDTMLAEKNKKGKEKPTLFVIMEWFNTSHSVYRTHSEGLRGLKKHFHTVGFGTERATDEEARAVFDEFYILPSSGTLDEIKFILEHIEKNKPQVILYPSIGMFPLTMYMSNLRLAPIQVTALGHGASSMATCIDYYAVESDFVGDPACFSEKVLELPKDALPFVRSKSLPKDLQVKLDKTPPPVVKVAVAATTMKYNPKFLQACQRIANESSYPVELQFFPGLGVGLIHKNLLQTIRHYVPTAVVHSHLNYPDYIETLKGCDLFINPFPYGNMNGIADMLELHMVGVCLTGPQIHEKIDHGIFERVGFPDWTIARTHDEYVAAACKLIDDHALRYELRNALKESKAAQVLYQGQPEILSEKLFALLKEKK